jgi:hypothetical protein
VVPASKVNPPDGYLVSSDFNGDGLVDVAGVCAMPGLVAVKATARYSDGTYGSLAPIAGLGHVAKVADVNGDALLDIADASGLWALNRSQQQPQLRFRTRPSSACFSCRSWCAPRSPPLERAAIAGRARSDRPFGLLE